MLYYTDTPIEASARVEPEPTHGVGSEAQRRVKTVTSKRTYLMKSRTCALSTKPLSEATILSYTYYHINKP